MAYTQDGRAPPVIVSVAHLDDDELTLVLGRAAQGDLHLVNTPQVDAETMTLWSPPDADS